MNHGEIIMNADDLLIEIGCEELPPKALRQLSGAFTREILHGLEEAGIGHGNHQSFATPRRLGILINQTALSQPDKQQERRGPSLKAAYDDAGKPTHALTGFAKSCGVSPDKLETISNKKGEWLVYRHTEKGGTTAELLPEIVHTALKALPIPKRMRWGDQDEAFVRPVHWVVCLHGHETIPLTLFGIQSGNTTRGHRFIGQQTIVLREPAEYVSRLKAEGKVIADFDTRREQIRMAVRFAGDDLNGKPLVDETLLDEVTALVEWPAAISGRFDKKYLQLPREVLIAVMQDHQRYFPVQQNTGRKLMPAFITISNIDSKQPQRVVEGNERVIRPRLEDALFFWEQDRSKTLDEFALGLGKVVFEDKLGSIADRSQRIAAISRKIANDCRIPYRPVGHAATICKADLLTDMVVEFTELQGVMGRYYALHEGLDKEIATAIDEHYQPRFAGDKLPKTGTGQVLALADKLDLLAGQFAIGNKPTGTRDPYGLRRAALGMIRIIIERDLDLDLARIIKSAVDVQPVGGKQVEQELLDYLMDRLRGYYAEEGYPVEQFRAVAATGTTRLPDFNQRIKALSRFVKRRESTHLAAAHKRIRNILRNNTPGRKTVGAQLLKEKQEKTLHEKLVSMSSQVTKHNKAGEYARALSLLATLQKPVDDFFDHVMVMTDDSKLRNNRLALLNQLDKLLRCVADFSCLP